MLGLVSKIRTQNINPTKSEHFSKTGAIKRSNIAAVKKLFLLELVVQRQAPHLNRVFIFG